MATGIRGPVARRAAHRLAVRLLAEKDPAHLAWRFRRATGRFRHELPLPEPLPTLPSPRGEPGRYGELTIPEELFLTAGGPDD